MNQIINYLSRRPCRLARCTRQANCKVEPNAAYTPSEMQKLANRGIPVSAASVPENLFFDGFERAPNVPTIDHLRGVDAVEIWEKSRDARSKIVSAHLREVSLEK